MDKKQINKMLSNLEQLNGGITIKALKRILKVLEIKVSRKELKRIVQQQDEAAYTELIDEVFSKIEERLNPEDKEYFYSHLPSSCIKYIKNGESEKGDFDRADDTDTIEQLGALPMEEQLKFIRDTSNDQETRFKLLNDIIIFFGYAHGKEIADTIISLNEEDRLKYLSRYNGNLDDGLKGYYKAIIVRSFSSLALKAEFLSKLNCSLNERGMVFHDCTYEEAFQILQSDPDSLKYLNWGEFRVAHDIEEIKENLEKILKVETEGYDTNKYEIDIDTVINEILPQMEQKHELVLRHLDFRLVSSRYIDALGIDKISQIVAIDGPEKIWQSQLCKLSEKKFNILCKIIEQEGDGWDQTFFDYLHELTVGNYDEILEEYGDQLDIDKFCMVLSNTNFLKISTLEEFEKYDECVTAKCDKLIESEKINDKRKAVLQMIFRLDIRVGNNNNGGVCSAESLIEKYGEDIDSIENQDLKDLINCLKAIMNSNEAQLEEIYVQFKGKGIDLNSQLRNTKIIEKNLKSEYGKLFNEGLFQVNRGENNGQVQMIEAGTDFKMIITSVSPYNDRDAKIENAKDNWNRPSLYSSHICTSYIRNDMIALAPVEHFCYGFNSMEEGSLLLSGDRDIGSGTYRGKATSRNDVYYSPDKLINSTHNVGREGRLFTYNEMDFSRIQRWTKKATRLYCGIKNRWRN